MHYVRDEEMEKNKLTWQDTTYQGQWCYMQDKHPGEYCIYFGIVSNVKIHPFPHRAWIVQCIEGHG